MSKKDEFPDLPTISDVLSDMELADGSNLDEKHVKKLVNLKRSDKSPLFRVENVDLIMNVIATIDKIGFDETFSYLKYVIEDNDFDIIKKSPIYIQYRKNNFIELTKDIVLKQVRQSIFKCNKCGGKDIDVTVKQMRSSDEGATETYKCNTCGNIWKIG